jgi:hypothetical protein
LIHAVVHNEILLESAVYASLSRGSSWRRALALDHRYELALGIGVAVDISLGRVD